jgi:bifunctional DNase/RNase
LKAFIEKLGGKMLRVIIIDIKEGTFYANIEVEKGKEKFNVDARPSDAIALAVRAHIPIFVSEVVMMQAKLVNAEKDAEETKKFKEFIQNMKPEDFTKYYKKD